MSEYAGLDESLDEWADRIAELEATLGKCHDNYDLLTKQYARDCERIEHVADLEAKLEDSRANANSELTAAIGEFEAAAWEKGRIQGRQQGLEEAESKYNDLIMQVEKRWPGESRHETAKRYIVERETSKCNEAQEDNHGL
jgi:chromosome segregation ATPase